MNEENPFMEIYNALVKKIITNAESKGDPGKVSENPLLGCTIPKASLPNITELDPAYFVKSIHFPWHNLVSQLIFFVWAFSD